MKLDSKDLIRNLKRLPNVDRISLRVDYVGGFVTFIVNNVTSVLLLRVPITEVSKREKARKEDFFALSGSALQAIMLNARGSAVSELKVNRVTVSATFSGSRSSFIKKSPTINAKELTSDIMRVPPFYGTKTLTSKQIATAAAFFGGRYTKMYLAPDKISSRSNQAIFRQESSQGTDTFTLSSDGVELLSRLPACHITKNDVGVVVAKDTELDLTVFLSTGGTQTMKSIEEPSRENATHAEFDIKRVTAIATKFEAEDIVLCLKKGTVSVHVAKSDADVWVYGTTNYVGSTVKLRIATENLQRLSSVVDADPAEVLFSRTFDKIFFRGAFEGSACVVVIAAKRV